MPTSAENVHKIGSGDIFTASFGYYWLSKNLSREVLPGHSEIIWSYAAADFIISRAGALSVSELCIVGKPVIFIPSPNVAEDHQTKNALAVTDREAAILIRENELDATFESKIGRASCRERV